MQDLNTQPPKNFPEYSTFVDNDCATNSIGGNILISRGSLGALDVDGYVAYLGAGKDVQVRSKGMGNVVRVDGY